MIAKKNIIVCIILGSSVGTTLVCWVLEPLQIVYSHIQNDISISIGVC